MSKSTTELMEETAGRAERMRDRVSQTAGEVWSETKDAVSESVDQLKHSAAAGMEKAADKMTSIAPAGVSRSVQSAANYVRSKSFSEAANDVKNSVQDNPGRWIAVSFVAGFVASMMIRPSRRRRIS